MDGITQLGINLPALITQVISFVILLLVLTKLLYKPLLKILDERSEKVKNSLTMADEAHKEAEKARAEMQEEIKAARIEGQETVTKAKNIAEKQGEEELVKAKKQIEAESPLNKVSVILRLFIYKPIMTVTTKDIYVKNMVL